MNVEQFGTLNDAELEQVQGGSPTITLTVGSEGISLDSPLIDVSVPNPFRLVGDAVGAALGAAGNLLTRIGGALTRVGQLFDFG